MQIKLNKGKDKPDTLVCVRADGTSTIARLNIPTMHDLIHYAVETTLGLRESFYGLVERGISIQHFNSPGIAISLPDEAIHTEHLVNLLTMEMSNGKAYEDLKAELARVCKGSGRNPLPAPGRDFLTPGNVETIRAEIGRLLYEWRAIPPGETMTLEF
ncbi:MAG: hypothetical protein O7G85_17780 [Planctomycetota bacterium]|nr:hypothetical protein [Planctomycetota bacterium]